ncbi:MAG: tRNA (guanosine(37)-N1)-methyltransferase TrmD [Legionella sp.]|nr:tRNA (guanosine(37)-N1)-methyltransferase TrmD [Legionella sp.]
MHFGVITLFPEILTALQYGVVGRAIHQGLARVDCWNPRDWANLPARQVDDKPYGGGPGMVMQYAPLAGAIQYAKQKMPLNTRTIYLSPQGRVIKQRDLNEKVQNKETFLLIAGRYEGIDERIITHYVDEEWSLGDFVLSGGELAAAALIDAMIRLLPGSLGHEQSAIQDSFMDGLLDCPHYTRPATVDGYEVPQVLLEGNHRVIEQWRKKQSLGKTWLRRPELLQSRGLNDLEEQLLTEFIQEQS